MTRKVLLAATILMTPWTSEAQTTARLDLDWPERFWSGWLWSREPASCLSPVQACSMR